MLSTQLRAAVAARESATAEADVLSRRLEASIGDIQAARADSAQRRRHEGATKLISASLK